MVKLNDPLVSCLCVTENRPAFIPWLLWNYERQVYKRRELVIVDSSERPFASDQPNVRIVTAPPGTGVAAKRNLALRAARGELITWFDDDDWQHPEKLTSLVAALTDQTAVYAGTTQAWFVDLRRQQCVPYQTPQQELIFNSAAFRREAVAAVAFPETVRRASDTRWLQQVARRYAGKSVDLKRNDLFFWLCHEENLSNPAQRRRFSRPLSALRQLVGPEAWADTDEALADLRERLGYHTAVSPTANGAASKPSPTKPVAQSVLAQTTAATPVTACLLSWKRPENLQPIVNSLLRHSFIREILVWNNNPQVDLQLKGDRVRIIPSEQNELCYGRYLCAQQATYQTIYFQDDDVIVENVAELYQAYTKDRSRIVHGLTGQHLSQQERAVYRQGHVALLGWGSFIDKSWLEPLASYVASQGVDALLRREADKFFSLLQQKRHKTMRARLRHLPGYSSAGLALYQQPAHRRYKALAVRRALAYLRRAATPPMPVTWNVVITCHNYGCFLPDAIDSVLLNDADYVITLVDDASTDETAAVAADYCAQYEHITCLRHEQNRGVSHARNSGVAQTDSLFVILLDADDKIGPDYLYTAEKLLWSGCDVVNPDAILFGDKKSRWSVPARTTVPMLLKRNSVHCAAAFRRSYWVQVGGVDESMDNWSDYDFWIRMAGAGARIQRLAGDHFYYRQHGPSKSTVSNQKRQELRQTIESRHQRLANAAVGQ
jgi:glycosyltransferase involved in cell wall biosynthesis